MESNKGATDEVVALTREHCTLELSAWWVHKRPQESWLLSGKFCKTHVCYACVAAMSRARSSHHHADGACEKNCYSIAGGILNNCMVREPGAGAIYINAGR